MTEKTLEDIQGYEYDWLACDQTGHVALFSTAGEGYAPKEFLLNTEGFDKAIEAFLNLPATTTAKAFPMITSESENTWKHVAERGMYGYDASLIDGTYKLISIPQNPALVDHLPSDIATVIRRIQLNSIRFNEVADITKLNIIKHEV